MITSITTSASGRTTVVTAVSNLSQPIWYFWYLGGAYVGGGRSNRRTFVLPAGQSARVDVLDGSTSTPPASPVSYPPTRTILFVRSIGDVARYRIEQSENSGAWTAIAFVQDNPGTWSYSITTANLDDLSTYAWRVVPIDAAGNDGTPIALASELIVRMPDAPVFAISLNGSAEAVFAA